MHVFVNSLPISGTHTTCLVTPVTLSWLILGVALRRRVIDEREGKRKLDSGKFQSIFGSNWPKL